MVIVNGKIYFNNFSGDISSVDIQSGELLWQTPTESRLNYDESFILMTSDIIADKSALYFSNNKNKFFSLDIHTGTINWKQKINSNLRPTLIDDYIFTVSHDSYLVIIEKNTGNILRITDVLKSFKDKKRNKIHPTGFIVGNTNIYLTTDNGRLIVLDLVTGKTLSVMKIDNQKISRPSVLNDNLFIITIHEMLADDHGEGVHNHIFPFITIILKDGYWETLKDGKFWRPVGYIGFRSSNTLHRVDLKEGTKPLTIFISGPFGLRKGPRSKYGINFKKII